MFKHNNASAENKEEKDKFATASDEVAPSNLKIEGSESSLKELVEKNLKWSQIIYEQNRKINRKLFWVAFAGWMRFFIIAIPLALAIWLLPPFVRQLTATYGSFLKDAQTGKLSPTSLQDMIKLLPINEAQKQQVSNFLK